MERKNWAAEAQSFLDQNKNCLIRQGEVLDALAYLKDKKNYTVLNFLGAGCFGLVMYAKADNEEEVAIKLIVANNNDIQNAEKEAKIVKDIKSQNIVQYKSHFSFSVPDKYSEFFIVTEYCAGGDIRNFRDKNPNMTLEELVQLFLQFLNGLKDLRITKTIHGDIKPENILMTKDKILKICDLGLAKQMDWNKSYVNSIGGNIMYKPPQEEGVKKVDFLHDIYSAGGILFFLCDPANEGQLVKIKNGILPNVSGHKFERLFKIAFEMMKIKKEERLKLNTAISLLKKMIGQEDDDRQDDMDVETFEDLEAMLRNSTQRLSNQVDEIFGN